MSKQGFWHSPISAEMVASAGKRFSQVQRDQGCTYWLEQRPLEGGRQVVMCAKASGDVVEVTSAYFNVRSRVHEYGGGDYVVKNGVLYFVNSDDQNIYQQKEDGAAIQVTHTTKKIRYADYVVSTNHQYLIAVREIHGDEGEPVNELVRIEITNGKEKVMVTGEDFYASPKLSPDETQLAWISWSHPQMPWDGTVLWCAQLSAFEITSVEKIAGGIAESLYQPEWNSLGKLFVASDQSGWWNIYRVEDQSLVPIAPMEKECGTAHWVFGTHMYGFSDSGDIVTIATHHATQQIGMIKSDEFKPFELPVNVIEPYLAVDSQTICLIGANEAASPAIYQYDLVSKELKILAESSVLSVDQAFLSIAKPIAFKSMDEQVVHAFYYTPMNPNYRSQSHEKPPLLVFCHSGPTAATTPALSYKIQYWTSRGFAVVDVNYRGSLGYGRAYRDALNGNWGVMDVADCVSAARYLVAQGVVDPARLYIRGSSAGGLTVLNALTFYDDFAAGASYYGVSDLTGLLDDTHKFEAKTLDALVGCYPEHADRYYNRSPVHFADQLKSAVIFFQGLKDHVVPAVQAEQMIAAMQENNRPYQYVTFEDEGHGFRDANTVRVAMDAECAFYRQYFLGAS